MTSRNGAPVGILLMLLPYFIRRCFFARALAHSNFSVSYLRALLNQAISPAVNEGHHTD